MVKVRLMGNRKGERLRSADGVFGDITCSLTMAAVLAGTSFGSLLTVGVREYAVLADPSKGTAIIAGATVGIFLAVACACFALLRNAERLLTWADGKNPLRALALAFNRKCVVAASAVILACWIPYVFVQFPVALNDDTYNQLYQFQTSAPTYYTTGDVTVPESYVDHHPVFDTLLYGTFLSLGDALGSQNAGLFLFSVLQCAFIAVELGLVVCYLEKLGVPKLFRIASLAFFALFPPIPLWAATMVKDMTNILFFVPFALFVAEAVRSRGALFGRSGMKASFVIIACMCILTKKTGVIVVAISVMALAVCLRSRWAVWGAALGVFSLIVCFIVIPTMVYPLIGGVAPGGKQEMFGFAFQQVVTAMNEDDNLADWERESLDNVLDVDKALRRYNPSIADPVKNSARVDASMADYLAFVPAYFSIGLRHPLAYAASTFDIMGTLVTPGRTLTFFSTPMREDSWTSAFEKHDVNGELHLTFDKPEPFASTAAALDRFWRESVPKLGPLQVFANTGFYGGWIPLGSFVIILFRKRSYATALVPALSVVALLLLSPASSVRYILPLLYTTPLTLGLLCASLKKNRTG